MVRITYLSLGSFLVEKCSPEFTKGGIKLQLSRLSLFQQAFGFYDESWFLKGNYL